MASTNDLTEDGGGGLENVLGALGVIFGLLGSGFAVQSYVGESVVFPLIVHGLASLLIAISAPALMPRDAIQPALLGRVLFGAIAFFIPIAGGLGLALAFPWALHSRTPTPEDPWLYVRPPDLPLKPLFMGEGAPLRFSEGALALVLKNAPDPDKRVAAVMALRRMAESRATPLLRIALRDPIDDVRLLAYALTDGIDKEINRRIQRRLVSLEQTSPEEQARLRKAVAQDYWDIAFLGLASGDVESHVLSEAARHLERVLDLKPDGGAALLLGRIRLRQRRPTEAEAAFARARALGLPSVAVGPYRAESAFQLRRFGDVQARLSELPSTSRARLPLAEVLKFWLGEVES